MTWQRQRVPSSPVCEVRAPNINILAVAGHRSLDCREMAVDATNHQIASSETDEINLKRVRSSQLWAVIRRVLLALSVLASGTIHSGYRLWTRSTPSLLTTSVGVRPPHVQIALAALLFTKLFVVKAGRAQL